MKTQTKLENNFSAFARKATLIVGAIGLAAALNTANAQCPPPTITPSGPVDLCSGGSVTLTATAGATYLWSNGATTQSIVVTTGGSFIVTVDDGAGCIVGSAATVTTFNTATPGGVSTVTGPTKACSGQSHVFSVSPVLRAAYYIWTIPTGSTISGQSGTYQTTSPSVTVDFNAGFIAPGSVSVMAYNGCGSKGPSSKSVAIDIPTTPASLSGPTTTCAGATYTFSTPIVSGVTTYNWTAPLGSVIVGQGTSTVDITFPAGYIAGVVSVVNSNACGTSAARNLSTKSIPPKPQAISGPAAGICGTTSTYSIPPVAGATSYTWSAPSGCTVVSGQGTTTCSITFSGLLNNGYVRVTANNSCGPSPESKLRVDGEVLVTTNPANVNACAGSPVNFAINAQGSNVIYRWQKNGTDISNGGTITGANTQSMSINPVAVGDIGSYRCIVSNACSLPDTSDAASLSVTALPGTPGAITGASVACDGYTAIPYSIAAVSGATSYTWTAFDGATIASGNGTNAVTVNFGPSSTSGYTLRVRATNSCGVSDSSTTWIRRAISTPLFATAPAAACAGTNAVAFDVTPVAGATSYTWTAPANASIASGQGTDAVTVDFSPSFTTGQICVTASNLCVTTVPRCKNVVSIPATPGAINGPSTNLCNTSGNYTVGAVYGATLYTWVAPTGATVSAGQGTNAVTIDFGPTFVSGNISVTAKNTCGDSPVRVRAVIATPAKPGAISGNVGPCINSGGNVYSVAPVTGATSYVWTLPVGASITSGAGTNSITVQFGAADGIISVKAQNACGLSAFTDVRVTFSCRIQGSETNTEFSVYPNPASDRLIVNSATGIQGQATVKITDVAGRVMISQTSDLNNGNVEINVTSLKSGVYFVETSTENGKFVNRFVKN